MKALTSLELTLVLKISTLPETFGHLNVQPRIFSSSILAVTRINIVASYLTNDLKVCLVLPYHEFVQLF